MPACMMGYAIPSSRHNAVDCRTCSMLTGNLRFGESVGYRQAEHLLGNEAQDHLAADRCDARDHHLAQIAFDMELFGVAVAAMGHHGLGDRTSVVSGKSVSVRVNSGWRRII